MCESKGVARAQPRFRSRTGVGFMRALGFDHFLGSAFRLKIGGILKPMQGQNMSEDWTAAERFSHRLCTEEVSAV